MGRLRGESYWDTGRGWLVWVWVILYFRSWTIVGHATRHMTALGLHLDVAVRALDYAGRQTRAGIFYLLYSLEILLAEVTGRSKSIVLEDITVPVDSLASRSTQSPDTIYPLTEGYLPSQVRQPWLQFLTSYRSLPQSMTGGSIPLNNFKTIGHDIFPGYFLHRVRLCKISHGLSSALYTASHRLSWREIQQETEKYENELKTWRESIPQELDIQQTDPTVYDPRPKLEIAMYYHSVQMILYRPCLAHIDIPDQSDSSRQFNLDMGRACVDAAIRMLDLLPDKPTDHECYQLLPSWGLLHYICQAAAVLALELALELFHVHNAEADTILIHLRKALGYIYCLSQSSLSAYKAWRIFYLLVTGIQTKYGYNVGLDSGMSSQRPRGWSDTDEEQLADAFSYTESMGES